MKRGGLEMASIHAPLRPSCYLRHPLVGKLTSRRSQVRVLHCPPSFPNAINKISATARIGLLKFPLGLRIVPTPVQYRAPCPVLVYRTVVLAAPPSMGAKRGMRSWKPAYVPRILVAFRASS